MPQRVISLLYCSDYVIAIYFCDVIEVPPAELYRILHCILSVRPSVCLFKIDRWSKVRRPTKQCHFTGHMTQPTVDRPTIELLITFPSSLTPPPYIGGFRDDGGIRKYTD